MGGVERNDMEGEMNFIFSQGIRIQNENYRVLRRKN